MNHIDSERISHRRGYSQPPEPAAESGGGGILKVIRGVAGNLASKSRPDSFEPQAQPRARGGGRLGKLVVVQNDVPSGEQLLERLDTIYPRPLSEHQEQAIRALRPDERQQFMRSLLALESLRTQRGTAADYLFGALASAADLAAKDGPRFAGLVALSSGIRSGKAAVAADVLDRAFHAAAGEARSRQGFHPAIAEVTPLTGVPQLFARALAIGAGELAAAPRSAAPANRAEQLCVAFGNMVGRGLREGSLTPGQACALSHWALRPNGKHAPEVPWPSAPAPTRAEFSLARWLAASAR